MIHAIRNGLAGAPVMSSRSGAFAKDWYGAARPYTEDGACQHGALSGQPTPSFSAAIRAPSTRLWIFWNATSRA